MSEEQNATEANAEELPQLALERIYAKDMSLEVPSAAVFTQEWSPELDINMSSTQNQLDPNHYEVILTVTVNAKNENETAFVAEVHQAGIFLIANIPDEQMGHVMGAYCPNVLFPYAREAISDIVTRASFPQLLLSPVNFDAAYEESLKVETEGNA